MPLSWPPAHVEERSLRRSWRQVDWRAGRLGFARGGLLAWWRSFSRCNGQRVRQMCPGCDGWPLGTRVSDGLACGRMCRTVFGMSCGVGYCGGVRRPEGGVSPVGASAPSCRGECPIHRHPTLEHRRQHKTCKRLTVTNCTHFHDFQTTNLNYNSEHH